MLISSKSCGAVHLIGSRSIRPCVLWLAVKQEPMGVVGKVPCTSSWSGSGLVDWLALPVGEQLQHTDDADDADKSGDQPAIPPGAAR